MDEETPPPLQSVPHIRVIIFVTVLILAAFGGVTAWVLAFSNDATTKGAIIQTWNNLAIAAGTFWLGSSLGGKMAKK